jgi:hypothetical protein
MTVSPNAFLYMTVGQMPVSQMPVSQMAISQNDYWTNACRTNSCRPNTCRPNACQLNASQLNACWSNACRPKCLLDKYLWAKIPFGQNPVSQNAWWTNAYRPFCLLAKGFWTQWRGAIEGSICCKLVCLSLQATSILLLCLHEDKTRTVALFAPLFANSDKHTNLLSQSINCLCNKFYNEDPYTKWKIFDFFL